MANSFDELAEKQRQATEALARLTKELRRSGSGENARSGLLRERSAVATPQALSEGRARGGGGAPGAAVQGTNAAQGANAALATTTEALRELTSGLSTNSSALRSSAAATAEVLSGLSRGLLNGLGGSKGVGGLLKGGFGLAPLGSAILKLFGGGRKKDEPQFETLAAPPPIRIDAANRAGPLAGLRRVVRGAAGEPRAVAAPLSQVVVNVNALDSRSFLDRSNDIADAMREAMLHMHPVNDVIDEL